MGAWPAQLEEHVALDLKVVSLSPMLDIEITKTRTKNNKNNNNKNLKKKKKRITLKKKKEQKEIDCLVSNITPLNVSMKDMVLHPAKSLVMISNHRLSPCRNLGFYPMAFI